MILTSQTSFYCFYFIDHYDIYLGLLEFSSPVFCALGMTLNDIIFVYQLYLDFPAFAAEGIILL